MSSDFFGKSGPADDAQSSCVSVVRYGDRQAARAEDCVATEEPLEIRLGFAIRGKPAQKSISVTMRTPGHDRELAAGFLFGESMIASAADIERFEWAADDEEKPSGNVLRVHLAEHVEVDTKALTRHFYTTSSCGVCGKASIDALEVQGCSVLVPEEFSVAAELVCELPRRLRRAQDIFDDTGGLHAAGLFDASGELVDVREDVGRHNAMDKLVGAQLLADKTPIERTIVVLSGRASFELLQKAVVAQIPVVVAVGAPSSLAVRLADEFGITLVGFARDGRFNVYTHNKRINLPPQTL